MKPQPQLVQGLVALTAAIAIAVTGYWWFFGRPSPAPAGCITNPPARIGGPLALSVAKEAGQAERADFKGAPTLLYFGFTRCPDICPTTMYLVEEALTSLGERAQHVQTALVSLDPEHDTPEALAQYVRTDGFPRGLVGLTGAESEIAAAAKAFAVNYQRVSSADDYTISHTSFLYVLDGDWRMRSMISTIGVSPVEVAACLEAGLGRDLR
jgi:protein SCO1/2